MSELISLRRVRPGYPESRADMLVRCLGIPQVRNRQERRRNFLCTLLKLISMVRTKFGS
jgi:hypothetical protein